MIGPKACSLTYNRMDYSYGKIYRMLVGGSYYYGSTVLSLNERLYGHKVMMKKHPHLKVYAKIQEVGWDNVIIELVEEYPCESKEELLQRETTHINLSDPLCLNMRISFQSEDERKIKEKEQNKKYRLEHLEHLRQKSKEYKKAHPLTDEQKEARRTYQREYMRKRRTQI